MNGIVYPPECKAIIDVTKPPYNVDNTGKTDVTHILCRIIDDILGEYGRRTMEAKAKLEAMEDENALISFEIRKVNGRVNAIFPEELPNASIIYFPNGIYSVSGTVSYSFEEFRNISFGLRHMEMNAQMRFMGQSQEGVVIKLKDNCHGFEYGNDRPVISFIQGETSNIAMTNMFENFTIDVGSGNPGATGVRYFSNNTGAVRNVKIMSSDPEYRGNTGFSILHDKVTGCYVKNIEVVGFNYGIKVASQSHSMAFEHIRISNQKRTGVFIGNTVVAIRGLISDNFVNAVKVDGFVGMACITDAVLRGGNPYEKAICHNYGYVMLRNIKSEGYEFAFAPAYWDTEQDKTCFVDYVDEFCYPAAKVLFDDETRRSLNLPVEETPEILWHLSDEWVSVNEFGAAGDGINDDTDAIQKALNSGKKSVYFQPGKYVLTAEVEIPAWVERINFMYSDLVAGGTLSSCRDTGVFTVRQYSDAPLIIEDLFVWEKFYGYMSLIEHACTRILIISDVHVQAASIYFNTVPGGKVFIENTGCTIGGVPGAGARTEKLPHESDFQYSREIPCFSFKGQTVYARQFNPERSLHEAVNDGGILWVLGFKTEEEGTAYETKNGGHTEILGGTFALGFNKQLPIIINEDSNVSVFASTFVMNAHQQWPIAVRESRAQETQELLRAHMPIRFMNNYLVVYAGRAEKL